MAPFMTVGIALHRDATKTIQMASLGERPNATTAAPLAQVLYVTRSENQYITKVAPLHVRLFSVKEVLLTFEVRWLTSQ